MVSTRSGRVVSAEVATSFGRITRSRAKKDAEALQEEAAADVGQPEVTSPAPPANFFKSQQPSPQPFAGFGSPLGPGHFTSTPVQQDMTGTPFQERVVKTIGKSAATTSAAQAPSAAAVSTPAASTKTAATPSAKEVNRIARVPLPMDAGSEETEPFASSDDELAGPASPGMQQTPPTPSHPVAERSARKGVNLLFIFAFGSLLVTAAIALLLSPCLDREQYAALGSRNYERVCRGLARIRVDTAERADHIRAVVSDRVGVLHQGLPTAAADALDHAWSTVKQAHLAAATAATPLVAKAAERLVPLWDRSQPVLLRAYRMVTARAAPVLDNLLERVMSASARAPAAPASITCISFDHLLVLLDQESVSTEYLRGLWDKAARDLATKQKATVWLLTCRHSHECLAAQQGLQDAASSHIQMFGGAYGGPSAAGELQWELVKFLRAYPGGLVLVRKPEKLHPNSLAVFANAASESGHLQMDGKPVATKRALYVFLVQYEGEEAAVKNWLTQSIVGLGSHAEIDSAVALSFRRRVDAVLPVRKVPPVVVEPLPVTEQLPSTTDDAPSS